MELFYFIYFSLLGVIEEPWYTGTHYSKYLNLPEKAIVARAIVTVA